MFLHIALCILVSLQTSQILSSSRDISPVESVDESTQQSCPLSEQPLNTSQQNKPCLNFTSLQNLGHTPANIATWIQQTTNFQSSLEEARREAHRKATEARREAKEARRIETITRTGSWVSEDEKIFIERAQYFNFLLTQNDLNNVVAIYRQNHQSPSLVGSASTASAETPHTPREILPDQEQQPVPPVTTFARHTFLSLSNLLSRPSSNN